MTWNRRRAVNPQRPQGGKEKGQGRAASGITSALKDGPPRMRDPKEAAPTLGAIPRGMPASGGLPPLGLESAPGFHGKPLQGATPSLDEVEGFHTTARMSVTSRMLILTR